MQEFRSVCILGRQPAIGLAELESLYGAEHIYPVEFEDYSTGVKQQAAKLDIPAEEINFKRLGGTIKTARLLSVLPYSDWKRLTKYLLDNIPRHLQNVPAGKFTMGLSVYGLEVSTENINRTALEIKKLIRHSGLPAGRQGRPVRIVPNKTPALSSAQVLHNHLTHKGAWELILIADGHTTLLAQTLFVQDINDYASRDQMRPKRDPKVGMLPPKLAQIIINLAVSQFESSVTSHQSLVSKQKTRDKRLETTRAVRVLDPFCGTGVILQEALLMGYNVLGTDIDQRMVEYSKVNIKWLFQKYPHLEAHVVIEPADAIKHRWPRFNALAAEVYLGRPLSKLPEDTALKQITSDTNTIIGKFLKNLAPQLKPGQRICLAVPAWRLPAGRQGKPPGAFVHLPLIAKLTDMGYNKVKFEHVLSDDLVYFREGQIVARELLVLERR